MTVDEILQQMLQLAHHENSPNTQMLDKALSWLNAAYSELLDELAPFMADQAPSQQTVTTDANGQANLTTPVRKVERVVNDYGQALQPVSLVAMAQLQSKDHPSQVKSYNLQDQKICIHPATATSLTIYYLPQVNKLSRTDGASAIKIPPEHHGALIWGGLIWASVYERGFSAAQDMRLFEQKWLDAKQQAKLSLLAKPQDALRTAVHKDVV